MLMLQQTEIPKTIINETALTEAITIISITHTKTIIDETALVQSLREDRLAAAALDVFAQEPLPEDSKLWNVENLLVTPHVSGGTQFEGQYVLDIFRENLERFVRSDFPLRNQVNKQLGF